MYILLKQIKPNKQTKKKKREKRRFLEKIGIRAAIAQCCNAGA